MGTNDLVSIIIPCYNQGQYLEEAVNSAIGQTYPNIEIIIVNDGSTDNSEEIALTLQTKYPEKIRVITQQNSGVSEARNNAIKKALGTYILPLDGDDLIDKTMISSCVKSMIDNRADIVYVDIQCFGIKNYIVKKVPFEQNNILYQNLCSVTSLYKKNVWNKLNGYNKNMKEGYEDWEFWINAFNHGFTFHHHPETLLFYRTHDTSRDTEAEKKDAYLKAKIVTQYTKLYTTIQVQEAIRTIREADKLADLYFYHNKDILDNEKIWITEICHYLQNNPLKKKQILEIFDKKVGLYDLDTLENHSSIQELYKNMGVDTILFYASLRYSIPSLHHSKFAWNRNEGIFKAHGILFPFVFKCERENPDSQLIAYKRLVHYQNTLIAQQRVLIENKNKIIEDKINLLKKMNSEY